MSADDYRRIVDRLEKIASDLLCTQLDEYTVADMVVKATCEVCARIDAGDRAAVGELVVLAKVTHHTNLMNQTLREFSATTHRRMTDN